MPYSVGLESAVTAFLSAGLATQFTVAVIVFLVIISIISASQEEGVDAPRSLPGYSIFHITPFFRKRYDFLNWGFHATGQNIFQLNLLRVCPFIYYFHTWAVAVSLYFLFFCRIQSLSFLERAQDRRSLQPRDLT